jgi:hypothetical protein
LDYLSLSFDSFFLLGNDVCHVQNIMPFVLGTSDAFHADRDITLLTMSLTSLVGMRRTLGEHQLDFAHCEGNDIMLY